GRRPSRASSGLPVGSRRPGPRRAHRACARRPRHRRARGHHRGRPRGLHPHPRALPRLVAEARLTIRRVAVESGAVTPSDPEVAAGGQAQLAAEATFVDGSRRVVTGEAVWESLNPAVAEVDGQGLVTGVANGSTDVTASFGGKSGSARVRVSSVEL